MGNKLVRARAFLTSARNGPTRTIGCLLLRITKITYYKKKKEIRLLRRIINRTRYTCDKSMNARFIFGWGLLTIPQGSGGGRAACGGPDDVVLHAGEGFRMKSVFFSCCSTPPRPRNPNHKENLCSREKITGLWWTRGGCAFACIWVEEGFCTKNVFLFHVVPPPPAHTLHITSAPRRTRLCWT